MTRYHKVLGMFLVTVFGLWGCARGPVAPTGNANGDKVKTLEVKVAKLEDDLKATLTARDQMRKKLQDADESLVSLHQEIARLEMVAKERDNLRGDLQARTLERDQLQSQFDTFRRSIKDLLGQAETSLKNGTPNAGLASGEVAPGGN